MSAPVEFSLWAPLPHRVRVQVDGTVHDMQRDDGGWWRTEVEAGRLLVRCRDGMSAPAESHVTCAGGVSPAATSGRPRCWLGEAAASPGDGER